MMMKKVVLLTIVMLTAAISMGELAGYWAFEEGSSTAIGDSSGKSHDGVLNANDSVTYPQWITGQVGNWALEFNASATGASNSNNIIIDPNSSSMDPNALDLDNLGQAFTITMWLRRDSDGVNPPSYTIYPRPLHTNAYDVQLAADPTWTNPIDTRFSWLGWATAGDSGNRVQLADEQLAMPTIGTWYHMAVVCDGTTIKQYIDGVEQAEAAIPGDPMVDVAGSLYIGTNADGNAFFEGAIDDVAVWAGSYLPAEEVAKLAAKTATPLTVVDETPIVYPPNYFTLESNNAWNEGSWKLLYGPGFSTFANWSVDDIVISSNNTASVWYIKDTETAGWPTATMVPGGHYALWSTGQRHWYYFRDLTPENYYGPSSRNVDNFGMAWVDPSWSGVDPNIAKFAPYITSDIALCMFDTGGYEEFVSYDHGWLKKDFFKTYARVAAVDGAGASLRVKSYSYFDPNDPLEDPNCLTLLGEVVWPLPSDDYVWEELKYAFPKPLGTPKPDVWVEISIVGGNANTRVYIDEFNPVSDRANTSYHDATYKPGDIDQDAIVNTEDLITMAIDWLDAGLITEPRDTGMLVNGDFYADLQALDPSATEPKLSVDPAGWTFGGPGGSGESGIYLVHKPGVDNVGVMNYTNYVMTPLGGTVSAYTNEPGDILEQTVGNAVTGQTYYVMAYVMAKDWNSWKDFAIVSLEIDGVEVAVFERALSRNRWRPVYGTYTAVPADNGKPITIKIAYDNRHTDESPDPEIMYIGYVYLDDVMPAEWPEGRDNVLSNGGFEDIEWMIGTAFESVYNSIYTSDNWGAWFPELTTVPAPPGWLFEVPSGFNDPNEGGIWASGQYGTPLPTPGMNDVCIYATNDLILGQIVGSLASGTYYLDMACGVLSGEYDTTAWPSPAPNMHVELWRIPSGVTDPATIHTGISTSQPGYTMITEAYADAAGNISGGGGAGVVASKWQMIGTSFTLAAAENNVYVRVYGADGAAANPEFAFSDVYLSTEKRVVPGGDITFDISGMSYDDGGPYTCYHASLMGLDSPEGDVNGDCEVNLIDLAILAGDWLEDWYTNITGTTPWE